MNIEKLKKLLQIQKIYNEKVKANTKTNLQDIEKLNKLNKLIFEARQQARQQKQKEKQKEQDQKTDATACKYCQIIEQLNK